MLIFNANQLNSLQEIFVTVLILYPTLIFLVFRAYLLEPPPQDCITKRKTMKKSQNSNEVKMVVLVLGYALSFVTSVASTKELGFS
jgi:hypothetical protein